MGNPVQLAYCLINPYTIYKSRTGGVIARLFTRTTLELVAARMFAPSKELAQEYAETIVSAKSTSDRQIQELIRQYVLDQYAPDPVTGQRRRVMMLLFRGEDAARKLRAAVGQIEPGKGPAGETIRDTYGDYIVAPDGTVVASPTVTLPSLSPVTTAATATTLTLAAVTALRLRDPVAAHVFVVTGKYALAPAARAQARCSPRRGAGGGLCGSPEGSGVGAMPLHGVLLAARRFQAFGDSDAGPPQ
jgi:nucleoside diphosphate kinase